MEKLLNTDQRTWVRLLLSTQKKGVRDCSRSGHFTCNEENSPNRPRVTPQITCIIVDVKM